MIPMNDNQRRLALGLAVVAIAAAIVWIEAPWRQSSYVPETPEDTPEDLQDERSAAGFQGAVDWINTDEPVDLVEQRGEVVLVDFWTYSCRNCINTFPYLRAWHDAYADDGLQIVGVHTPEFRFERNIENVEQATERYNLTYPVAIDNEYEIWDAYNNRFWPSKYLIGPFGKIRYSHFGEGAYDETEDQIRAVLNESSNPPDNPPTYLDADQGGVAPGQTPELFASHLDGRTEPAIANEEGYEPGETITYAPVDTIERDRIYLEGTWANRDEFVRAEANASIRVSFQAGGANFVANDLDGACAELTLDRDGFNETLAGPDVTVENGTACVHLHADRAYDLYSGPFEEHEIRVDVPEGFELYSFAFSSEGRSS
jgi:thiol-disulfide isomerase/thioredoxin